MSEFILYGIPKGETERYTEALLTVRQSKAECDTIAKIAERDGFHSFRIAEYNGERPNFTKTIN